jgi:hypothetical protein
MRTRINLTLYIILLLLIGIGILVLRHQNNSIRQLNEAIRLEQVDDSVQRAADSIKYRQMQLKNYSDSMAMVKAHRDAELILIKQLTKKKINKYENIIKILPNATDAVRDSIWKSELTKPEQSIK